MGEGGIPPSLSLSLSLFLSEGIWAKGESPSLSLSLPFGRDMGEGGIPLSLSLFSLSLSLSSFRKGYGRRGNPPLSLSLSLSSFRKGYGRRGNPPVSLSLSLSLSLPFGRDMGEGGIPLSLSLSFLSLSLSLPGIGLHLSLLLGCLLGVWRVRFPPLYPAAPALSRYASVRCLKVGVKLPKGVNTVWDQALSMQTRPYLLNSPAGPPGLC